MKKAFTITELLVAVGLLAAVLAASSMIFHYSIDAHRTALATAEVMRNLRAITDQLNSNLGGLRKDSWMILWSSSDANDALYFFSNGDFQSWYDPNRSDIARVYFGTPNDIPTNLAMDFVLLTPGYPGMGYDDHVDVNFADCYTNPDCIENVLPMLNSGGRPATDIAADVNNVRRILAQNVGTIKIQWTTDSAFWDANFPDTISWFGLGKACNCSVFENNADPYWNVWDPGGQWPEALKFTFTLYDSKGILKNGRTFEHIVYIGN